MGETFNLFLPLSKVEKTNDGGCIVAGYASTPSLDLDGEIISIDAVRKALPGYWAWRNIREMHQPRAVGVAKEANIDGKGLFLTSKITDKEAVQKCLDDVYKGYSIGGRKLAKTGNVITEIDLIEVSLVDRPANPDCRLEVQKSAKISGAAHLLKTPKPNGKRLDLLSKAADIASGITEFLKNDGAMPNPPAARDGFSLPAIVKGTLCKAHSAASCPDCTCTKHATVDCEKCAAKAAKKLAKRDFNAEQRRQAAASGAALPDGSFPIKNQSDLDNAVGLWGHAKDKSAARKHIISRAHSLGLKLPDSWAQKLAKKLAKQRALELEFDARFSLTKTPDPDFLTLNTENITMAETTADLGNILAEFLKAGKVPTKAQHFAAAKANMKKAKDMRKAAAKEIKAVHDMHKRGYLAKQAMVKAGKKPPADGDADDFDHAGAMEKLQKAFTSLNAMKTFSKAASQHMAKAAGNRGPLEGTDEYTVPMGVKGKTNKEMSTEGPGGGESGSAPPELMLDTMFPGKAAKANYTPIEVEMALRLAAANGKVEALEKMPAMPSGGRRPAAFDTSKFFGKSADTTSLFKGVDIDAVQSADPDEHNRAISRVFGNMVAGGHGKSVFDTSFHGTAGADTTA